MTRKLHILMFPQRTYPSDHAMLETVYAKILPQRGHRVTWIMRRGPGAPRGETATWGGTTVHLVDDGNGLTRWRASLAVAERVMAGAPADIIQVRNDLVEGSAALVLRRRSGARFVYQVSIPFGEMRTSDPGMSAMATLARTTKARIARRARHWLASEADAVLAISDAMRADLEQHGVASSKILTFPLGFDAAVRPDAQARARMRAELDLGDAPTVIYIGAIDRRRRLELLLDAMVLLVRALPSARLLIVGAGDTVEDATALEQGVRARSLGAAVRLVGRVPRARVADFLVAADVSVSPIPPVPIYTLSSPTKVIESLGVGVPVVANAEIPDQARVITESGGGVIVPYRPDAFAAALERLLRDPATARLMGRAGQAYVLRERSYERLADLIETRYAQLT